MDWARSSCLQKQSDLLVSRMARACREKRQLLLSFRLLSHYFNNFLLLKIFKKERERDSPCPQNLHLSITLSPSLDFHLPLWLFSSRWVCSRFDLLALGLLKCFSLFVCYQVYLKFKWLLFLYILLVAFSHLTYGAFTYRIRELESGIRMIDDVYFEK